MLTEIKHLIHIFYLNSIVINFCWVPSHCGILQNEKADIAAKQAAKNERNSIAIPMKYDLHEGYTILEKHVWHQFSESCDSLFPYELNQDFNISLISKRNEEIISSRKAREVISLAYKIKLNALKTKHCKNIHCICGVPLMLGHILDLCQGIRQYLPDSLADQISAYGNKENIMRNPSLVMNFSKFLLESPLGIFL